MVYRYLPISDKQALSARGRGSQARGCGNLFPDNRKTPLFRKVCPVSFLSFQFCQPSETGFLRTQIPLGITSSHLQLRQSAPSRHTGLHTGVANASVTPTGSDNPSSRYHPLRFASGHAAEWFHRRTERLCYQISEPIIYASKG